MTEHEKRLEALSVRLADEGRLIEAGWVSLRRYSMAPDAPDVQVREMRMAFMAGAQHLFASIIMILEPGDDEPTEKDLRRMDRIAAELETFRHELEAALPTRGRA